MTLLMQRHEQAIGEVIERHAPEARRLSPGRWAFDLVNGKSIPVTTRVEEGWAVIEAWPALEASAELEGRVDALWRLARLNGDLDGGARLAISPTRRSVHVCAEVPLDDEGAVTVRFSEALHDVTRACAEIDDAKPGDLFAQGSPPSVSPDPAWSERIAGAGWTCHARSSGRLVVDLDVPGSFHQARLLDRAGGGLDIDVELVTTAEVPAVSRNALGLLLLTASSGLRLARGQARDREGGHAAGFGAALGPVPLPSEINHALTACSVACRWFGREAKALTDERVARAYLDVQGWATDERA